MYDQSQLLKKSAAALAGCLSWLEHFLVHQNVGGLISDQGNHI